MTEELKVEVPADVKIDLTEETQVEITQETIKSLSAEEQKMAQDLKLIKEELKAEEKPETKKEETKPETAKEEESAEAIAKFNSGQELTHKEEDAALNTLDRKGQAFYFRMKEDRRRRQEAQNRTLQLEKELEELRRIKIEEKETPKETEIDAEEENTYLTKKELKEILESQNKKKNEEALSLIQKEEQAAREKHEKAITLQTRWKALETQAESKDPEHFNTVIKMATEMIESDEELRKGMFNRAVSTEEIPGEDPVSYAYKIAKYHPEYAKRMTAGKSKAGAGNSKDIEKMIENSKKMTSANLDGGSGKKLITEDELTLEDAVKLSTSAFAKLSKATQERLLRG